ncbi:hypothetical protein DSM112329_00132 [Paraconexibacter sp. AEG42_29]|uniref:DUF5666 domain-containing protein n=1 Tax=Paraconexibacter sp. AEG42_29 TaxID=2997339 RepID=A0AAU7ANU5_9ACTN
MRKNRLTAVLTAAGMATVLVLPGAADARQNTGPKAPTACKAGAMKKDKDGAVTHVCNKKGKWVKVLYRTAGEAPAAQPASEAARQSGGGGTPSRGCDFDGAPVGVGDTVSVVVHTRVGSRWTAVTTTFICGDDGKLHQVARTAPAAVEPRDAPVVTAADTSAAKRAGGAGTPTRTCADSNAAPGDEVVVVVDVRSGSGKLIKRTVTRSVCGDDGWLHPVAR